MPRYARPHITGGLFHVICRFHERKFFFDTEGSRDSYLTCLARALSRVDTRLLAYCLMSSHVHLVLQLGERPLGSFTRSVNTPFANWLNRKLGRIGPVFANRPASVLCDSETYALELVRYVHNNPVRAGVVRLASESRWSSHRAYLGLDEPPEWLDVEPVLLRLGDDIDDARRAFSGFVDSGDLTERRPEFCGELPRKELQRIRQQLGGTAEISYPVLGPDEFVLRALGGQVRMSEDEAQFGGVAIGAMDVLDAVCAEIDIDPAMVLTRARERSISRARRLTAWVWTGRLARPQTTVAALFDVRPSAVSQMLQRMRGGVGGAYELDVVENIVRRIRQRIMDLLEQLEKDGRLERDSRAPEVQLLQRLREVDRRLFGPRVYSGSGDATEAEEN